MTASQRKASARAMKQRYRGPRHATMSVEQLIERDREAARRALAAQRKKKGKGK